MSSKESVIKDFNSTVIDFAQKIAIISPSSIIGQNIKYIVETIKFSKKPEKFIETFILKVLIYEDNINDDDEGRRNEFFLSKSYDEDLDGDNSMITKVFEFKNMWEQFNKQNRDMVVMHMKLLCILAGRYFDIVYN